MSDSKMRALVWNNPYGALMLHGKIETRLKPTNIRGEVLICTAKKAYPWWKVDEISGEEQGKRMAKVLGLMLTIDVGGKVCVIAMNEEAANNHGYAIGVATLVDCRPMTKGDEDATFVMFDKNVQRYCWVFDNVRRIRPFEWKFGKQGWLFVPDSELGKIIY